MSWIISLGLHITGVFLLKQAGLDPGALVIAAGVAFAFGGFILGITSK